MSTKKLIIRHTDNDGLCSGRIVYDALIKSGVEDTNIIGVPAIPGKVFDIIIDSIKKNGTADIFLVDLSITMEELNKIPSDCNLIWIDHHVQSIDVMNEIIGKFATEVNEFLGLKFAQPCYKLGNMAIYASNKASAARLCWDVFFGGNAPYVVDLISDHDIFKHEMEDSIRFFNGTTMLDLRYLKSETWDKLVTHPDEGFINKVIADGDLVMKVNKKVYSSIMRNSFEFNMILEKLDEANECFVKSEPLKGIAVNTSYGNSFVFGDEYEKHDIAVCFRYTSDGVYNYTIYSAKHSFCVAIAETFNGGGHPYAAGFSNSHNIFNFTGEDDEDSYNFISEGKNITILISEKRFDEIVESGDIVVSEEVNS